MAQKAEQVKVTWEDQQNINSFSKFNMRKHELEALIQGAKKALEDLEDASAELMLADEEEGDGGVRMLVGSAFLAAPKDDAEARVEELTQEAQARLAGHEEELGGVMARLAELKATLYGRLGSGNINLEE
ncbi:MAG: hypothetical protein J3K34DRAFT_519222 [Monoraphidium minutum]|nr:MAG: hypothetical protein J3K34DRAFT_519222 [Monoraphidium minutum]